MLTPRLALLAYAELCAVEAEHDTNDQRIQWLLEQGASAELEAQQRGATERDWRALWRWMGGGR